MGKTAVRWLLGLSVALATSALVGAASAAASVQIGATFTPDLGCGSPNATLQAVSPSGQYAAPSAGVLTSWSFQADGSPPQLKFKVGRSVGGNDFTIVGDSPVQTMTPNALNTFPTRIPVQAGDVIGYYHEGPAGGDKCVRNAAPTYSTRFVNVDPAPGSTMTYMTVGALQVDLSAVLEPDADHDGFGDETQDKCVGTAGTFNGCPNTVTVNKLKQKGTKPKVKVKVTVPGAGTLEAGSASDPMLASAAAATSLKPVTETLTSTTKQHIVLILKLTKSAKRKLSEKGKLKAKVKVLYTPPGGPAGSQTDKVKLKS
jgi:hypothetical protein